MYQLTVHDQITDYENRMDAVTAAKDLTGRPDGPVATVTDGAEPWISATESLKHL